ncbi:putative holin-like toxin [Bacillus sp. ISL-55]
MTVFESFMAMFSFASLILALLTLSQKK